MPGKQQRQDKGNKQEATAIAIGPCHCFFFQTNGLFPFAFCFWFVFCFMFLCL
jgi:hypothetical protein